MISPKRLKESANCGPMNVSISFRASLTYGSRMFAGSSFGVDARLFLQQDV